MSNLRKYNFSPGPAQLPEVVLERVQEQLLNWQSSGSSVLELSHRGKEFAEIAASAEANLRKLLGVSDKYAVLFLQGGASTQFATIPMNFAQSKSADYLITGNWSKKAFQEAERIASPRTVADGVGGAYLSIPKQSDWDLDPNAAYLHLASNETVGGVQFKEFPKDTAPLVCDMSSDILSRTIDVNDFKLIYAGAQKNLGPAGVTIVILDKEFAAQAAESGLAKFFSYRTQIESGSMYNTPPCFSWYVVGEVLKYNLEVGIENVHAENNKKSSLLYECIDSSSFYANPIDPIYRSGVNIPFTLVQPELDAEFLNQAAAQGLINLKGHRSVGGMRASIYNAMPYAGVKALVDFMQEFERNV